MTLTLERVRPSNLSDLVGLDHVVNIVNYSIQGAKKLGEALPHFLISGPSGVGKTTISMMIATLCGGELHRCLGSDIGKSEDLYGLAQQLKDGDSVLIEESHSLKRGVVPPLLTWMEESRLLGGAAYGVDHAPRVSFCLATTNPGKLPSPLRNRCIALQLAYLSVPDLESIIRSGAERLGFILTDDNAVTLLARSSRGTPRTAIQRLDQLRKVLAVENMLFSADAVAFYFSKYAIDVWGLEANDRVYLEVLYEHLKEGYGRPVARKTLEQVSGFSADLVQETVEPYLIQSGMIQIVAGGRILTELGYHVLDKDPLVLTKGTVMGATASIDILRTQIKWEEIDLILKNEGRVRLSVLADQMRCSVHDLRILFAEHFGDTGTHRRGRSGGFYLNNAPQDAGE